MNRQFSFITLLLSFAISACAGEDFEDASTDSASSDGETVAVSKEGLSTSEVASSGNLWFTGEGMIGPRATGKIRMNVENGSFYVPGNGLLTTVGNVKITCGTTWISDLIAPAGPWLASAKLIKNGKTSSLSLARDNGASIYPAGQLWTTWNVTTPIYTSPGDTVHIKAYCTLFSRVDGVTPFGEHLSVTW